MGAIVDSAACENLGSGIYLTDAKLSDDLFLFYNRPHFQTDNLPARRTGHGLVDRKDLQSGGRECI
jgi:hypothetical protein